MPLAVGDRLGPYQILAPIGAGGMGEVYKARDTRLDRTVAIKISQEKFSERFEREARAVAALNHPHICTLHDVGPDYLVMEYIEGTPLQGPLPVEKALAYAGQILDALDEAHKHKITHGDLKPANILVTKNGIKLLDFGLARMAPGENDPTLTHPGDVMGTPAYMAPEQWDGKRGDARSDIYAFGCVLYEMLTGKRAAQERTPVEPAALEKMLATCLRKDPEDRWQSARDVKAGLGLVQVGQAISSPAMANSWRERAAWIAVAVVLAAVALFFALSSGRPPAASETIRFSIYPPEKTAFSGAFNVTVPVPEFALSPDGRAIVFVAAEVGAKPILWLRTMDEVAERPLPGTEDADSPFWSWDGRWVGFFAGGKLKAIPASGGPAHVVADGVVS